MILERQSFYLGANCVIEKLQIRTPFQYLANFQDEACFLHIRQGGGSIKSADGKMPFPAAEGALLPCGAYLVELQATETATPCEILAVHLTRPLLMELLEEAPASYVPSTGAESEVLMKAFFEQLAVYVQYPTLFTMELIRIKMRELVLLLLYTKALPHLDALLEELFKPRLVTLRHVVKAHVYENTSLEELAILCGRSLSAFKREFKAEYGCTPGRYLREKKIERASNMLQNSRATVSEIAYSLGFSDPSHFGKLFKQHFGKTPQNYRA
jgi:AraC-like DNA-binding protein